MNFRNLMAAFIALFCAIILTILVGAFFGYPSDPEYSSRRINQLNGLMGETLDDDQVRQLVNDNSVSKKFNPPTAIEAVSIILKWYWYLIPLCFTLFLIVMRPSVAATVAASAAACIIFLWISVSISLSILMVGGIYGVIRRVVQKGI